MPARGGCRPLDPRCSPGGYRPHPHAPIGASGVLRRRQLGGVWGSLGQSGARQSPWAAEGDVG
eukprot:10162762-Alexandrium_andersonii.AAC.1